MGPQFGKLLSSLESESGHQGEVQIGWYLLLLKSLKLLDMKCLTLNVTAVLGFGYNMAHGRFKPQLRV
jgi:hypothetical protein